MGALYLPGTLCYWFSKKISGYITQLWHLHGPLEAPNPGIAANAQIWFYNPKTAIII